jgi:H+-transporting ATPase
MPITPDTPAGVSSARAPEGATAPTAGLTSEEARRRLAQTGRNAMPEEHASPWGRLLGKLWAPIPWMLEAAVLLQLVLGEFVEAGVISLLVLFNAVLGFVQEGRARETLEALKSRLALMASVKRDGRWSTIAATELVPGDLVKLTLGGVVAADARILEGEVLLDQSTLTGESLPIEAGPGRPAYAGSLVRRGEALAEVTATGVRTRFGRTAELVRTARGVSSQQATVLRVVRNLAIFDGVLVVAQVAYAAWLKLPTPEIIPLTLTAILAAIPVALPATFTLASALGARALARKGVLPTRLSAVEEAATLDVLCADKTGTLTRNALAVSAVKPMPGYDETRVLALAALASSDGGQDPVDGAVRAAWDSARAAHGTPADLPRRERFTPFDPRAKTAEAAATDGAGRPVRVVKGAFATVRAMSGAPESAVGQADELAREGLRVLAVAEGAPGAPLALAGLVALSDPPRDDSAALVKELRSMGVRMLMVTGDAPNTAAVVARAVGLEGAICGAASLPATLRPEEYAVFAGVFPEDKYHIVMALQKGGHTVGMCGDGANDAPALRQAQMGIAVSTATDVAKSAAGIVLTEPGLGGIVNAVREGRIAFQRILTYTFRSLTLKLNQMLLLAVGLVMFGHAILTPRLMALLMITGDFLAMSATTDNVHPSPRPNAWHVDNVTLLAVILALGNVVFGAAVLAIGRYRLGLDLGQIRTLAAVTLMIDGQAIFYVVRDRRRLWSSRPGVWVVTSSVVNVAIISLLAIFGVLMRPIGMELIGGVLAASLVLALALDFVKSLLTRHLAMQ